MQEVLCRGPRGSLPPHEEDCTPLPPYVTDVGMGGGPTISS